MTSNRCALVTFCGFTCGFIDELRHNEELIYLIYGLIIAEII